MNSKAVKNNKLHKSKYNEEQVRVVNPYKRNKQKTWNVNLNEPTA